MFLLKDNMILKPSKSALAKALDQRQTKDASKLDDCFSMEIENEFDEDKEENNSDVEENFLKILELVKKIPLRTPTKLTTLLMVVIFYIE